MILFTTDTDWAPDFILNRFFDEIAQYPAKWLIFATNDFDRLKDLVADGNEVGLHPNFVTCSSRTEMLNEVARLKELFPNAVFSRSHSLMSGGPVWDALVRNGITHDFSSFNPFSDQLRKRVLWNGLIQVEFNWEDDYHFHQQELTETDSLKFSGLKELILNFHPVHFFLNTTTKSDYEFYLENRNNKKAIVDFSKRNWEKPVGCGKLLIELLSTQPRGESIAPQSLVESIKFINYIWT